MAYTIRELKAEEGKPFKIAEGELLPLEPGSKYLFAVEVGNLPSRETMETMKKVLVTLTEVLGKNSTIVVPRRNGINQVDIYRLEESND